MDLDPVVRGAVQPSSPIEFCERFADFSAFSVHCLIMAHLNKNDGDYSTDISIFVSMLICES